MVSEYDSTQLLRERLDDWASREKYGVWGTHVYLYNCHSTFCFINSAVGAPSCKCVSKTSVNEVSHSMEAPTAF